MSATEMCRLCLSTDRTMFSIADVRWAYCVLTDTRRTQSKDERTSFAAVRVCWECSAALRRVIRLRNQALHAQWSLSTLADRNPPIQCLSKLSCCTKTYYDRDVREDIDYMDSQSYVACYKNEENIKIETNTEAVESDVFDCFEPSETSHQSVAEEIAPIPKTETELKSAQQNTILSEKPIHGQKTLKVQKCGTEIVKVKKRKVKIQKKKNIVKEKRKNQKKTIISKLCDRVLNATIEQLIEKHEVDEKSIYSCAVCSSALNSEEEALRHISEHRSNGTLEVLRCRLCTHLAGDEDAMQRHHDSQHPPARIPSYISKRQASGYDCDICGHHVKSYDYFKIHYKSHVQLQTYQCDICSATFRLRIQMIAHIKWHEMRFLCEICGKRCRTITQFNVHHLCHSSVDARRFACKVCPRKFITNAKLTAHMTFHDGVKPFGCDLCTRRFRMKYDLTRHKKLRHSGGKPVVIKKMTRTKSLFTYAFYPKEGDKKSTKESKSSHRRAKGEKGKVNEVKVKEKNYQCNQCGKKFAQKAGLMSHAGSHTNERPYKCDECDLTFKYSSGLSGHKLLHRGVKPHQCTVCGAQFTLKGNLNGHMKIHTNDKPYECDICGHRFLWRKNLRNHLKVHAK